LNQSLRRLQVARGEPSAGFVQRVFCLNDFVLAAFGAFERPNLEARTPRHFTHENHPLSVVRTARAFDRCDMRLHGVTQFEGTIVPKCALKKSSKISAPAGTCVLFVT
jgi:hypothetical protein